MSVWDYDKTDWTFEMQTYPLSFREEDGMEGEYFPWWARLDLSNRAVAIGGGKTPWEAIAKCIADIPQAITFQEIGEKVVAALVNKELMCQLCGEYIQPPSETGHSARLDVCFRPECVKTRPPELHWEDDSDSE